MCSPGWTGGRRDRGRGDRAAPGRPDRCSATGGASKPPCAPAACRTVKTLAGFDFAFQPSIKREQIDALHEIGFVERRENVVFPRPRPVWARRTWRSAWRSRRPRAAATLTDLVDSLEEAKAAGRLDRRLKLPKAIHPLASPVDAPKHPRRKRVHNDDLTPGTFSVPIDRRSSVSRMTDTQRDMSTAPPAAGGSVRPVGPVRGRCAVARIAARQSAVSPCAWRLAWRPWSAARVNEPPDRPAHFPSVRVGMGSPGAAVPVARWRALSRAHGRQRSVPGPERQMRPHGDWIRAEALGRLRPRTTRRTDPRPGVRVAGRWAIARPLAIPFPVGRPGRTATSRAPHLRG